MAQRRKKSSIRNLIDDFIEHLEVERNCSVYTLKNYRRYLTRFADWFEKKVSKSLRDLDLAGVKRYRVYLSRYTGGQGRTLARVTQGYYVIALRSFLKWLNKNDHQVLAAEKVDLPKSESRLLKFLTREQVLRLLSMPSLSAKQGLRDKAILEVLFSTGLRVSELIKLNREQINFRTGEIGVIGKGRRPRVVFLSSRAVHWLKKYLTSRQERLKPLFVNNRKDVGAGGEKARLTARTVQRIVEKYRKKAGVPIKVTPHGLRHSFATDLLQAGAGLREVQEMLGHKNVATTQIYTHVTNPQLKKVHKRFHLRVKG